MAFVNSSMLMIGHGILALLLIIELGIVGWLVSITIGVSQLHFQLFNCIWSILILLYVGVAPMIIPRIVIPLATLGLLALTSLFWFAGSIALAVWAGNWSTGQAGAAFGFLIWAGFTALAVFEFLAWRKAGGGTTTKASTAPASSV